MAIALNEDNNIGSLSAVQLALIFQLAGSNPVVFKDGFDWLDVDFLPEQAQVKETTKIVDAGDEYSYVLTFAVNRLNADMLATVAPYIGQAGVIQYTDNNGLTRVIGSKKNPVSVQVDTDTGQQFTAVNGLALTATWVSERMARVVS